MIFNPSFLIKYLARICVYYWVQIHCLDHDNLWQSQLEKYKMHFHLIFFLFLEMDICWKVMVEDTEWSGIWTNGCILWALSGNKLFIMWMFSLVLLLFKLNPRILFKIWWNEKLILLWSLKSSILDCVDKMLNVDIKSRFKLIWPRDAFKCQKLQQ